jgi:hypothetical protein
VKPPSKAELPSDELGGPAEYDASAGLLTRFRAGDHEAGYELLGRQAAADQWKAVLSGFAAAPADVDLERIAGSTLGRHPDVVAAVINVLQANGSAQAHFVVRAIAELRDEAYIVDRAVMAEEALAERNGDLLDDRGGEEGLATLYMLLSQPLRIQQERWFSWREGAPDKAASVEQALEAEDERLQRLSKERSYRSGSYLHFLRHALANLVLVTGVAGAIGKRAFALLQRRVDGAEQQEELLRIMPAETGGRYLQWSLEPQNAEVVPRTRFALRMVREHFPDTINAEQLLPLCGADDPDIAIDAAVTGIAVGVDSRSFDLELARLLTVLDLKYARPLASALARVPERVDLARVDPERRSLLFADQDALSPEFCRRIAKQLVSLPPAEISGTVALLGELPLGLASDELLVETAAALMNLACANESYWPALFDSLSEERFRAAVWRSVPAVGGDSRVVLVRALIAAEPFDTRAPRAVDMLRAVDSGGQESVAEAVLAAAFDGQLDADAIAASWPSELRSRAISAAGEARRRSELEREEIKVEIRLGVRAYLADLRRQIDPLITLATARAAGNARLEDGYARLSAALSADTETEAVPRPSDDGDDLLAEELTEDVHNELTKLGGFFDPETGKVAFDDEPADASTRLRYVGVLDQRASRSGPSDALRDSAQKLLPAYVRSLGELGVAEEALRDLFSGGSLMPVVVQLSPTARRLVLEAAQANGFEPPAAWFDHPALGDWLHGLQLQTDALPGKGTDEASLVVAIRLTQAATESRDAARTQLERLHGTVKEAVARSAGPLFDEIDALIDSYAQLWHGLAQLGIRQIAPLGVNIARENIDIDRHEIVDDAAAISYVVRAPGLEIDGEVLVRARLEGMAA